MLILASANIRVLALHHISKLVNTNIQILEYTDMLI